jgi:hypothetical protein
MDTATKPQTKPEIELPPHGGALAVQESGAQAVAAAQSDTIRMMEMIMQAARDPAVDIAKFEKLMAMKDAMELRAKEAEFDDAFALATRSMEPVRADMANSQTNSRYASHVALDKAIRPHYAGQGFSLSFNTDTTITATDMVRVLARLSRNGIHRDYSFDVPADGRGAKGGEVMTKTHAAVSAVSYGIRVLERMIFNLPISRGEDDDGNAAGGIFINEGQADQLLLLISDLNADFKKAKIDLTVNVEKICERVGATNIESIPAKKYDMLVKSLKQWAAGEMRKAK